MAKKERRTLKDIAKYTLVLFIIVKVVMGGLNEFAGTNERDVVVESTSRGELNVVTTLPVIVEESKTENSESKSALDDATGVVSEEITESTQSETILETEGAVGTAASRITGRQPVHLSQISSESTTSDRIYALFDFLISEGFSPEAASGVIGNIAVESTFNPTVVSSSGYYGLFQWNTSSGGGYWWYDIQDWLSYNGYDWNSFEGQVKAMLYCSNRGFLNEERLAELKQLRNVEQAVELFAVYYEGCTGGGSVTKYYRPGSYYQDLETRKSEAWVAYAMYKDQSMEYNGEKPYSR
ncbi:MAG: hypothetical protein IJ629_01535 [Clostridia bacterium]|nr:hypothetical protein [Clostridia bacterium]